MTRDDSTRAETPPKNGHQLGVLLRAAYFSLRRCGNSHFERFDANGDQFLILQLLADGGSMNQLELVRHGGYDPSTATSILKVLERDGYVTREADPNDGRAKIVCLTEAGHERHKTLWKDSAALRRTLWKCVRAEDRGVFIETLQRIIQEMDSLRSDVNQANASDTR